MLQCVAVCCRVLPCVVVCCSRLEKRAMKDALRVQVQSNAMC